MRFRMHNYAKLFMMTAILALIAFVFVMPVMAQVANGQPVNPVHTPQQKIIMYAVAAAGIVQTIKVLLDKMGGVDMNGHVALVLNVITSASGIIALQNPDTLFSLDFLIKLMTAVLATAGVHDLAHYMTGGRGNAIAAGTVPK